MSGWEQYNHWNAVITPKRMTADELQEGFYWATREMSDFKHMKAALSYFWSHGPWPDSNPTITFLQRVGLIYLGLRFFLVRGLSAYGKFLWWAAVQKNTAEFRSIIGDLYAYEVGMSIPASYKNPADKYRALEAERAGTGAPQEEGGTA